MSPRVSGHRPGITRAILAGVVATTLGLAACGSDDADGDSAATSTTAGSSSAAATSEKTSTEASETSETAASSEAPDPGASAEPAPEDRPEGEPPAPAPADPAPAAGAPANQDDAAEIDAVARGLGEDKPWGEYQRTVFDTSCRANLDQVGGKEALLQDLERQPQDTMASKVMSDMGTSLPVVHGVNDIHVEGDRATANVDAEMNGKRQTTPVVYVREDGQWKTCSGA
jgi:pyruvate/2-oxoglutarate dehydrogenase complex dihydrolipoamide acyltransferase (E2) component